MPLRHAAGRMLDRHEADVRGVLDGLAMQRDLVLTGDRLRRILDRLQIFTRVRVSEAVEVVRVRSRPPASLREHGQAHDAPWLMQKGKRCATAWNSSWNES